MNRIAELRSEHGKLLQKVLNTILADGVIMDKQQMDLLNTLSRSKAFIQGYEQGYKEAQEDFKHKS